MQTTAIPYPDLDTPSVLVDLDKLEANIKGAQQLANETGLRLRPHLKSHECVDIARMQREAGAIGFSSAKLEEAERMAGEGFDDIMVLHPFFGSHKEEKLKRLAGRPGLTISCVVDMVEHAEMISRIGEAVGRRIPVLLKIDTGVKRFGVLPGAPALRLAREIYQMPGIEFAGIVTHESTHGERTAEGVDRISREVPALMAATARLLRNNGVPVRDVSIGSTPSLRNAAILKDYPEITELHPGMYVFGDLMYVSNFAMPLERCALSVLVTVIGVQETPPPRAMIDGGGKTFTPDVLFHLRNDPGFLQEGRPKYGVVKGRPDLWFGRLPAENGVLYLSDRGKGPHLGDRLEIIPNNASMVVAIHDEIYGVRGGEVERVLKITGRGIGN